MQKENAHEFAILGSGFDQQFSTGKNQDARQHAAKGDAAPTTRTEMRAKHRADARRQCET